MKTAIGILILAAALFLIVSVLLQSSKNHRMSGVVTGGAETFFGKQKGKTIDAKLSKATAVIAVVFAVLVLALYLINAAANSKNNDVPVLDDGAAENIVIGAEDLVDDAAEGAEEVVDEAAEKAEEVVDEAAEKVEEVIDEAAEEVKEAVDEATDAE